MAIRSTLSFGLLARTAPAPKAPRLGFRAMFRALQTRRQLAEMDDRMLRDIGISRVDAPAGGGPAALGSDAAALR